MMRYLVIAVILVSGLVLAKTMSMSLRFLSDIMPLWAFLIICLAAGVAAIAVARRIDLAEAREAAELEKQSERLERQRQAD